MDWIISFADLDLSVYRRNWLLQSKMHPLPGEIQSLSTLIQRLVVRMN